MSSRPVPKPRPPPKPDIKTVGKKPVIPPKPRRTPPAALAPDVKNAVISDAPPKRPFKPVHLSPKESNEKQFSNDNGVTVSEKPEEVEDDMYDDVRTDDMYDDVRTDDRVDNSTVDQEDFYYDVITDSSTNNEDTNSNTKRPGVTSKLHVPPTKPPPKLPPKSVGEITQTPKELSVKPTPVARISPQASPLPKQGNLNKKSESIDSQRGEASPLPKQGNLNKKSECIDSQRGEASPLPKQGNLNKKSESIDNQRGEASPLPKQANLNKKSESIDSQRGEASPLPKQANLNKKSESIDSQRGEASPLPKQASLNKKSESIDSQRGEVQHQAHNDKEQQKATVVTQRPQPPPKPRWIKALSKVAENSTCPSYKEGSSSSLENAIISDGSPSTISDIVENSTLNDDKLSNDCTLDNDGSPAVDDQFDSKPSRPIKKRMATRRQPAGKLQATSVSISEAMKRRPPPPPPPEDDSTPPKRAGSLKGPEIPKDQLRMKSEDIQKASSTESNIPKTAEEQSLYSYAYDHTFTAPSIKPSKDSAINNSPVITQDDRSYCEPDNAAVAGFMEELKNKDDCVSDGTYEIPADEGIQSNQSHWFIYEPEYVQPDDIIKEDDDKDSDVSDSDGEPDYEIPCDSPPPVPPHKSPLRSGIYDVTSPDDDDDSDDDEEDDYVEPPDAQGFSDEELDAFIGDESSIEDPLYQVYTARTLQRDRTLSRKRTDSGQNETSFEDLTKGTLRNMRMLWCEVPEVIASGILDNIDANERKRQEAMFEVITSEASYLKSLNILESHFISSPEMTPGTPQSVIEKPQHHILFSNVRIVLEASQKFLDRLRQRSSESLVVSSISDIIEEFAINYFEVYIKYCSNQIHQDRVLTDLRKSPRFLEGIERLEKSAAAQFLSLHSFLVLPMQRITRLPLLVDAICHRCEPGGDEFIKTDAALKAVHKIVRDCNEGARKMERMEEILSLQPQIEFTSKPIALVSANRWLLRRGEVVLVIEPTKTPLSKKKLKLKPVYIFLFNDLLLITKKKGENRYRVLDYAARNMTKVEESSDTAIQLDYMLSLILLENCNSKTKDFLLCAESETDKTRWLEAFNPPKAEQEGEKVYGAWDCPQVQAIHDYTPHQPDELALHEGDVINVQRKLTDGWHYGERLCDGVCGWFPANYTENILNEHVRARNLLQRYRLLAASKHLIGAVQTMKTPKSSKLTLKAISATLKEPKRDTFS